MEERVTNIHGLLKWLRPLCLELDSRLCWEADVQEHGWSDTAVPAGSLGETLCLRQTVETAHAWVHMSQKLLVRHPGASGAGLPGLLSQAHVPYIPPDPLAALRSCWKSCEISTVMSARANISAVRLFLASSCEICLGIFLLAKESWAFLWVKHLALELLSRRSWSWHCSVGHHCFYQELCVLNSMGN